MSAVLQLRLLHGAGVCSSRAGLGSRAAIYTQIPPAPPCPQPSTWLGWVLLSWDTPSPPEEAAPTAPAPTRHSKRLCTSPSILSPAQPSAPQCCSQLVPKSLLAQRPTGSPASPQRGSRAGDRTLCAFFPEAVQFCLTE